MTRKAARLLALATLLLALPVSGAEDTSELAYKKVREEVGSLRQDETRRQYRHHYERLIKKLRAIAEESPRGAYADDALFVSAQLYEEMYGVSYLGEDLQQAISSYLAVADLYAKSNLADDALFAAANLLLDRKRDLDQGRATLERLVAMAAPADFRPKARELLATLPTSAGSATSARPGPIAAVVERLEQELRTEAPLPQVEVLPDAPPAGTSPRTVEFLGHERVERDSVVALRVSDAVGVRRGEVPENASKARRLFYDLTPARVAKGVARVVDVGNGVIERVRLGQYDEDTVRLVVELEGEDEPLLQLRGKPFELRLSVSLADVRTDAVPLVEEARVRQEESVALREEVLEQLPTLDEVQARLGTSGAPGGVPLAQQIGLRVKRVVIDPGHGGKDTGAVGKKGTREKDVALQIAKQVRARLKERLPDIEVLMTRESDAFVALEERTRIANDASADLFISIHANANPSRKVSGVETYYLNITHDRYAIRLAARENTHSGDDKRISDLQFILADLAMKSNVDESIRLGTEVQKSLVGRLRENYGAVHDHGLKHALFYVLMGARMPAILVETSFISNRTEEERLRSAKYRDAVADGIVQGVERFVEARHAFYAGE